MTAMLLHVIGDGAAALWTGDLRSGGRRVLPGIEARVITAALTPETFAANLPQGRELPVLIALEFSGCAEEILSLTQSRSYREAVREVVARYVAQIADFRTYHTHIAVFGPMPDLMSDDSRIGTHIERNLALLCFSSLFDEALAQLGIPFVSVLESMLGPDATTSATYIEAGKLRPLTVLPPALAAVSRALRLELRASDLLLSQTDQRITRFTSIARVAKFGVEWMEFALEGEARFLSEVVIARETFASLVKVTVATTIDESNYPSSTYEFHGSADDPKAVVQIPINQYAKKILFCAEMGLVQEADVTILARVTPLRSAATYDKAALLALRDEIIVTRNTPVVSGDIAGRKKKAGVA